MLDTNMGAQLKQNVMVRMFRVITIRDRAISL